MFEKCQKDKIVYYRSTLLWQNGFENAFFTRYGGVSSSCFDSLNMSFTRKDQNGLCDSVENVRENYRLSLSAIQSTPEQSVAAKQVHENIVKVASELDAGLEILRESEKGFDGVLVRADNSAVNTACVKTADCTPILLGNKKTGDVCAVHAGWRGTATDIAAKAALELSSGNMKDIVCAIGPCIGVCCYEVGNEVYNAVKELFDIKGIQNMTDSMFANSSLSQKKHANLALINKTLLENIGVPSENIDVAGICTCCTSENGKSEFFSHRGGRGHSGTFLSAVKSRKDL